MVGGFNTNVRYKGRTFHVQTEDSPPKIVTLLYEGGVILHSRKQAYEGDRKDRTAVRERMEAQHAEMVRALKGGELDAEVGLAGAPSAANPSTGSHARAAAPAPAAADTSENKPAPGSRKIREFGEGVIGDTRLDELILSRFSAK
jgi:hypothetical protein